MLLYGPTKPFKTAAEELNLAYLFIRMTECGGAYLPSGWHVYMGKLVELASTEDLSPNLYIHIQKHCYRQYRSQPELVLKDSLPGES